MIWWIIGIIIAFIVGAALGGSLESGKRVDLEAELIQLKYRKGKE